MPQSSKSISPQSGGFFKELAIRIKLIFRLMGDERVSLLTKMLPIASLIYLFNPIDVPGPIDDAAVVGLGMYLFFEFCPPEVVEEHLEELRALSEKNPIKADDTVIDAEFNDVEEEEEQAE